MKTTKRILACLMILAMLAAMLCGSASAANINITGVLGVDYTIYKVFETEGTSADAILYKWPTGFDPANKSTFDAHLTTTITADGNEYVELTNNNTAGAQAFAKAVIDNKSFFAAPTTGTGTFSAPLGDGYYVMANDTNNTLVAFSVINGNVLSGGTYSGNTITAKGGYPTITKVVDDSIVAMGQTLTYTITVEAEENAVNYVLTDVIPTGLKTVTLKSITHESTDIYDHADVKKDVTADSTQTVIEVDLTDYLANTTIKAGDDFVITYTAVVDTDATIGSTGNKNTVVLTYGDGTKTTQDDATVYTSKISFTKYANDANGNPTENKLAGAKFVLMNDASKYAQITGDVVTAWVTNLNDATPIESTTDEVVIKGLAEGTYTFKETDAPAGYRIVTENTTVTIPNDEKDAKFEPAMAKIYNTPGNPLPETGGIGTTVFYAVGGLLVLGAVVILLMKKRSVTE